MHIPPTRQPPLPQESYAKGISPGSGQNRISFRFKSQHLDAGEQSTGMLFSRKSGGVSACQWNERRVAPEEETAAPGVGGRQRVYSGS